MRIENMIRILAGTLVLVSLLLSITVSVNWLFLAAFVGFNLIQSAFSGLCPAEMILRKVFPRAAER